MKPSTILAFALFLTACGVARPVLESDNTKVEVKTVEVPVHDTVYFTLPMEVEKIVTLDTVSILDNSVARSSAIVSAGLLRHSLETKDIALHVPVESKIVYKDSIVFRDRVETITQEIEKPLSGWQKAKLKVGGVCFFIVIIYIAYLIIHFIYNLNLFKL